MTPTGGSHDIATVEQLRSLYSPASERSANKVQPSIDAETARFVSMSPLLFLATTDGASVDISPRGGPPGFAICLDETRLAIPDLNGNNRLDSYENILANPAVGTLLLVPSHLETVRINGNATLSVDPDLLASFTAELAVPKMAIVIEVVEVFAHCAKAFRRSQVWQPDSWAALADAPDLAQIYASQRGFDAEVLRAQLEPKIEADLAADKP